MFSGPTASRLEIWRLTRIPAGSSGRRGSNACEASLPDKRTSGAIMSTSLHVLAAAIAVFGCLAGGYLLFQASLTLTGWNEMAIASGLMHSL